MIIINAQIGTDSYTTQIQSANHSLIADEPIEDGGKDLGFSPSDLITSSLAACTVITVRMYANRKNWPVENIHVTVNFERDSEKNISKFERHLTINGTLTEEQRVRLLAIAKQCYIHKVLTNPIEIITHLL